MVQILRLIKAASLWIKQASEFGRWRTVLTHHLQLHFTINKLTRFCTRQVRACATHGTLALLHLHHALFHSTSEILTTLAHINLW
jgi:hypothetical protein